MKKPTEVKNLKANLELNFLVFFFFVSLQRCKNPVKGKLCKVTTQEQHLTHKEETLFCWMQQFRHSKTKSAGRNQRKLYTSWGYYSNISAGDCISLRGILFIYLFLKSKSQKCRDYYHMQESQEPQEYHMRFMLKLVFRAATSFCALRTQHLTPCTEL